MRVLTPDQARSHPDYSAVLQEWLCQLADDELILGHRDSEWLGLCPEIEEDVAFSSIAQDEVGHAAFYYDLASELCERSSDQLAFFRTVPQRRNCVFVERENKDWAYTIVRHFLYDCWDDVRLQAMEASSYEPLAQGVRKMRREETYHLMHMKHWFTRFIQAEGKARELTIQALKQVSSDLPDLLSFGPLSNQLYEYQIVTQSEEEVRNRWWAQLEQILSGSGMIDFLEPIETNHLELQGRYGKHTPELHSLLSVMTEVASIDPEARW